MVMMGMEGVFAAIERDANTGHVYIEFFHEKYGPYDSTDQFRIRFDNGERDRFGNPIWAELFIVVDCEPAIITWPASECGLQHRRIECHCHDY
jgi:hypothetical protein